MSNLDKALETQLKNIQSKTGKTLDELRTIVQQSGLTKHGELRVMLQRELRLGHGDANMLVHIVLQSDGTRAAQASGATDEDVVNEIYSGTKAGLRPIHACFMAALDDFGPFEIVPKRAILVCAAKNNLP